MSILNLYRYYLRLQEYGIEKNSATTLDEIADKLCTSPRYARSLLRQMQKHHWLTWQPKVGRNQRSTLCLTQPADTLKQQLASDYILRGQYSKALTLLEHNEQLFARLLQHTSGASMHQGRLHIQLTYRRSFQPLLPHLPQRNSERFLLRQVYACLVRCDAEGQIQPELAHHWHYDAERFQWRFHLRPELTFHNGQRIDAQTIVELFQLLQKQPDYQEALAHLQHISAPHSREVLFEFSQPDQGFAGLISGVQYSIQPPEQLRSQTMPLIGCGPFKIQKQTDKQLILNAFEDYYGCRSLCDEVTIWLFDQDTGQEVSAIPHSGRSCQYYVSTTSSSIAPEQVNQYSRQEEGGIFLLINQNAKKPLTAPQRHGVLQLFEPRHLSECSPYNNLDPAYHILPFWPKLSRLPCQSSSLPEHITIAVYDYVVLVEYAQTMAKQLEHQGVTVTVKQYDYQTLTHHASQGLLTAELVLTSLNLDDNRHTSAYQFLYSNPLLHSCVGPQTSQWLKESLIQLRANTPVSDYLTILEPFASSLIHHGLIHPLFHEKQVLHFHNLINNAALTAWGWPDLKQVWTCG
ncbi:SgrR family transcriptional regulator [Vibrio cincinnatiensis]|uniref:DNA-binding transcriptional regulator SgrR of sgrS sRNA, contains a MarR-type HTH domain and a solute-binding domain n=1 Tax=Vibrio cincinnatiensis DSM 19608 TaxID=1123491 RepID=A0A1T4K9Z7_VIBCI|nr:SgrR family transcriptional regulator [Vibrio cincinnatiensis]MCG3723198.1 SgrR family transcriptional regulator [Vibrio cincinnatiensis]MCG3764919.1 SgrR family transcriptional regulator [Vibrio cincinnatiensis]SJZ39239.1 DNA-binding transcriptional regulator SgrR of sgrS sRNA, contains a MarR-type HTH domain and a solute-binding domain [Vibrio cincinnatiensis DSM 19608]SUP48731.1 OppA [Vibrio cincinnatiensis]